MTPTAPIQWSTYRAVNGQGFGSWLGPLEPTWAIEPVDGTTIEVDLLSATFAIGTLQTTAPGVYRVSNIAVHYDTGIRSRTADSLSVVCVLVTPPGSSSVDLETANDVLWQRYLECNSGG